MPVQARLPLILSATALAVAVLGATPIGQAAGKALESVPLFAKKAGYAKTSGFAKNAEAVNSIKAARTPTAGLLVPLGPDGRFPASVLQAGAASPAGPTGPAGATGATGAGATNVVQRFTTGTSINAGATSTLFASCDANERATGGGYFTQGGEVLASRPFPLTSGAAATQWQITVHNTTAAVISAGAYVMCAAP